jgi:hypothetical protein
LTGNSQEGPTRGAADSVIFQRDEAGEGGQKGGVADLTLSAPVRGRCCGVCCSAESISRRFSPQEQTEFAAPLIPSHCKVPPRLRKWQRKVF